MKTLSIIILLALGLSVQVVSADTYKCMKNGKPTYQASPCDSRNPDANKVEIKTETPEDAAKAAERLQQIRNEYDQRQKAQAEEMKNVVPAVVLPDR